MGDERSTHPYGPSVVRRIFLKNEAEQIFQLQARADVFRRHYPEHANWLRMAIDEIVAGRRFAFGVYVPEVRPGASVVDLKLAGSIILKSESYSKVMQLKNLYIDEAYRRRHLGTQLFQAVERFCVKRGSTAIDTEVPLEEKSTVAFLNGLGFLVHAHLDSPYRHGDVLYRMYKPLPKMYTRDPFDLGELTRWTLEVGFGFEIDRADSQMIEFSKRAAANGYLHAQTREQSISLRGIAYVSDQPAEIDSSRLKQMIQIHASYGRSMVIVAARTFSGEAQRLAAKRRVVCLSRADLDKSLTSFFPFAPPTFAKEQIGGILAPIKSAYIHRLNTAPNQEKTYFKGGPVGKFLTAGHTIFFYVESDTASGAIMAKATIRDARAGFPAAVWDESSTRTPVFENRSQYDTWSSDKTDVVAITYSNLENIEAIHKQDLHNLKSFTTLEEDQVGTFYLSATDVEVLLSRCHRAQLPPSKMTPNHEGSNQVSDLRLKLTNGERPDLSYPLPVPPQISKVSADTTLSLLSETQVLLVTAASIELDTALSSLKSRAGSSSIGLGYKGQAAYYFGRLGEYRVTVAKCKAGSNRRDGAALTVNQAIEDCNPWAVIAVGIAFGGYTSDLRIGDVLVSEQVIPYEIRRVGVSGDQFRGPIPEAGPVLLSRFANPMGWAFQRPDGYPCKVKPGPLLSGETLLDDIEEKVRLFSEHPTSIGGEMEAAGIYAAATRHGAKCEWIVVKAVCDWADGTKKTKGDVYQPLAAAASLSLVESVLSLPDALVDLRPSR